ncbi:hypothetical protein C8R43DRAFT_1241558 [Mycena crocata]|nr:hypothetical protein C8R43DRAFT_1241558 [Mycena crocata]
MSEIPQELLDGIISQLDSDDLDSPKACSLAGSVLRYSSQRILFRSFTLGTPNSKSSTRSCAAACTLFVESPHIAPHVRRLTILLNLRFLDLENLDRALGSFTSVRHCFVDGKSRFDSATFPHRLTLILVDFLTTQPLRHLEFLRLSRIPPAVVLGGAPSLQFYDVSISKDMFSALPAQKYPLQQLVLEIASKDVCDFLVQRQLKPHIAALRRLSLSSRTNGDETSFRTQSRASFTSATKNHSFKQLHFIEFITHYSTSHVLPNNFARHPTPRRPSPDLASFIPGDSRTDL